MRVLFKILMFFITIEGFSQASTCINADFELGNFTGWQGQLGNCCPINTNPSNITNGRHTIMTGTGTDPNTCGNVTVVAPGGTYSARLGNDSSGRQAEKLLYTTVVSPSNALFIYKYAVVLEDPDHSASEQPRFQISILNALGNLVDPVCGEYTVVASGSIPGFQTCNGNIRYKDWTTVGLDLTPYIGQSITIEFATGDCDLGAHFGYAYVDAYCSPLEISTAFCTGSFSAVLSAPIGFSYLWNTGETTQSINVNNPTTGSIYTCQLTSVTGCIVNISTILQPVDTQAEFNVTNNCYYNIDFSSSPSFTPANTTFASYAWNFGDGGTSTSANPTHTYTAAGNYTVTLTVTNSAGCSSFISHPVVVVAPPTAAISYLSSSFCNNNISNQTVNLVGTGNYLGGVFSSTVGLNINATSGEINPSLSTPGNYIISYTYSPNNNCSVVLATTPVTIIGLPTISLNYSSPFCATDSTIHNPTLSGTGPYLGGTYTSSTGLQINSVTGSINPSLSAANNYTITYTVQANGNCPAVFVSYPIVINNPANATISYPNTSVCNSNTNLQLVTISGNGNYVGGSYSSSPGLNINSANGTINPLLSISGPYQVGYLIPAGGGCPATLINTSITITPTPSVSISYVSPICNNISIPQAVTITGTGNYLGGVYSSTNGLNISSTTGSIIPDLSNPGNYLINYNLPALNGCPSLTVYTNIQINPKPYFVLSDGVICKDLLGNTYKTFLLNTGLSNNAYGFAWAFNGTPIPNFFQNSYTASQIGVYSVVATNLLTGCQSDLTSANITASLPATDSYAYVSNNFSQNAEVTVVVQSGTGPFLYQLDNGSIQSSNVFTSVSPGPHLINIYDDNDCTNLTTTVLVLNYRNYFTPNGDSFHNTWNITGLESQPNAIIRIYDRYGKFLKQIKPNSPGWDGTYNGNLVPSTDYWFEVDYYEKDSTGTTVLRKFKSHFSLLR